LDKKRENLKSRFAEIKAELFNTLANEYREIEFCGNEKVMPAQAVQQLCRDKERYAWLPGPIEHQPDFPLADEDIKSLYEINSRLSDEDIEMLECTLPDPAKIPTLDEFREVFDALGGLEQENLKKGKGMWRHADHSEEKLRLLLEKVTQAMDIVDLQTPWIMECIDAGRRQPEEIKPWKLLIGLVETLCAEIPLREELVVSVGPKVDSKNTDEEVIRICKEICAHLEKGKKLKKLTKLFKPEWREVIESCRVDDGEPRELEHFHAIIYYLEIKMLRSELRRRWDRRMEPLGCPPADKLGRRPETTARQYTEKMKLAITWFDEIWAPCEALSEELGLEWKHLLKKAPVSNCAFSDIVRLKQLVTGELQPVIETRIKYLEQKRLKAIQRNWYDYFHGLPKKEAS
ncbi:MAG: hypothetical protein P8X90_26500, partial [Desulfobacterales bacterium]